MHKTEANIRKSYRKYKELSDDPVDIQIYIEIANRYNKYLLQKVLEGFEITLPERMGTLSIIGTKRKISFDENGNPNLPVNWPATTRLWKKDPEALAKRKKIYHTNEHSDGITYKYLWSKKRIFVNNKNLYCLRLTRDNKRAVTAMINQGKEYFIKSPR